MQAIQRRVQARIERTNAVRAQFLGVAFGLTFLVSLVGDALSMGTLRNHAFMFLQFGIALLVPVLARWTSFGQRHGAVLMCFGLASISMSGAWHLGQFGGLDGPWFYGSYVSAPVLIPMLMSLRLRAFATLLTVGGYVLVYTLRRPDLFSHPMAHVPIAYLATIGAISVTLGEYVRRLEVEAFTDLARQDAAAEFLEARFREDDGKPALLRKEIARQLHDDVAQLITGARIQLDGWSRPRGREEVAPRLGELLDELSRRSRRMLEELREPTGSGPLVAALGRLRDAYREMGLTVDLLVDGAEQLEALDAPRVEALVSAAREGLTNAVRHARATEATLNLHVTADGVSLEVLDNGGGKLDGLREGYGLLGIRERAAALGGTATLTEYDGGLRLTATVPWPRTT